MDNFCKALTMNNLDEFMISVDKFMYQSDSDWEDYNKLMKALQFRQKDIAKLLIQQGARVNRDPATFYFMEFDEQIHFNISTPLHLAVSLGCPEITKLLLDRGASIYITNSNQETPLIVAAKLGKNEITDLLLSKIGEEHSQGKLCENRENLTHMHVACMRNRVDLVKKYLQRQCCINHSVLSKSILWPCYTPLHFAVQFQCIETVQLLVNSGADITAKAVNQLSPLHLAHMIRNETIIDIILSAHKYNLKNPVNSEGLSHFHIACTRNKPAVVEIFLQQGVNVNMKIPESSCNWSEYRPINFAIDYECADVVELLLLYNANLKFYSEGNINSLLLPIDHAYKTSNKIIIDLLLSRSSMKKINTNLSIRKLSDFHTACLQTKIDVVEKLIQDGRFLNKPVDINQPIWTDCTPLHLAISQKCIKTTKLLLKHGADITVKDARGMTPLHHAYEIGQMTIVDLILVKYSNGMDNPIDNGGVSHFHISCIREKTEVVKRFLQNGVNINSSVKTDAVLYPGYTPLHLAVNFNSKDIVNLLLKNGADIKAKNAFGLTALDSIIQNTDSTEYYEDKVETLSIISSILNITHHNNIAPFDDRGFSRLHFYCTSDKMIDSVERFLKLHPYAVNKTVNWPGSDWDGYTPLHFAVHYHQKKATKLLLKKGADISIKNAKGNTPLHLGFNLRILTKVSRPQLFFPADNILGDKGYSHFHIACYQGNVKAVQYFLERGVDVNLPTKFTTAHDYDRWTKNGKSPLHLAIHSPKTVKLLLKNGADINARDAELNSPLHSARCTGVINMLLTHGADVNALNIYKETPLLILFSGKYTSSYFEPEQIRLYLDNGADINIEDEKGKILFMIFDELLYIFEVDATAENNILAFVIVMKHIKKLDLIGYYISPKNKQHYLNLLSRYQAEGYYKELDFVEQCRNELEHMKSARLDSYTTLYSILSKSINEMALHSENNTLQEIINSADFYEQFPIYGSLLKLQLKRGLSRRPLLKTSKASLKFLTGLTLPDACSERIFRYLSNEDLQHIISSNEGFNSCLKTDVRYFFK